jgi:hypothetical protein
MEHRASQLRDQFFQLLDEEAISQHLGHDVWELFAENPWFQAEMHLAARRVLWKSRAPLQLAEGIAQDAMLRFGRQLRRRPDLNVKRSQAAEHFSGWLVTIME